MARCGATERPCPRSAGGHFSEAEYEKLEQEGDPRIPRKIEAAEDSYYTKAKKEYEEVTKRQAIEAEIAEDVRAYTDELYVQAGINPKTFGYVPMREREELTEEASKNLRAIYIEAGVNPTKATYIVNDIVEKADGGELVPVVRRTDRLDPDIAAKTKAAVEAAKKDAKFQDSIATFKEHKRILNARHKVIEDSIKYQRKLQAEYAAKEGVNTAYPLQSSSIDAVKEKFRNAILAKKAGVPDSAQQYPIEVVKPMDLSTDTKGKINNAWVQNKDGSVERIVSYSISGALETDKGTRVSKNTHYANYRSTVSGYQKIIISPKKGRDWDEYDSFSLTSSIDSGD